MSPPKNALSEFTVNGARVSRLEDYRFVTGRGRFASDWTLPRELHAYFVRSTHAHARIVAIDTALARAHPGVRAVFDGEDIVREGYVCSLNLMTFPGKDGAHARVPQRPALAHGKVRFVGEPLVLVVAESALIAQDAAGLVEVSYEDLPVAACGEYALGAGAPQLHDEIDGNLCFEYTAGDAPATQAAFDAADHICRLKIESTKVVPNPMEPRACLVNFDGAGESYTIHVCVQGAEMMRRQLAAYTNIPAEKIIVVANDVGGGFGSRSMAYPEYCVLMLAARMTGAPVKWVSTRAEGFLSDTHGRANVISGELALDAGGRFLGMRFDWVCDIGAYSTTASAVSTIRNAATCLTGVYKIPALHGRWRVAFTNTAPTGNYRGAGRPDIAYAIERLVNHAAAQLGIDETEIRRRNFIPPEAFPYRTPTGSVYDNADLPGLMGNALDVANWEGFAGRRATSAANGKLRGRGISTVIENTGAGVIGFDEVALEVKPDGRVIVSTVGHSQGQGHETTFAMIVAKALEIPAEQVVLNQRMLDTPLAGNHTGGSRTMVGAASVGHVAAKQLIEQGKRLAAEALGVEPSQVDYADAEFRRRDASESISIFKIAAETPLMVIAKESFGSTFPNDCHIAEVEIDPDTGRTTVASYVAIDDCGEIINPVIVEGQLHGGVLQGAGQVFGEHAVYAEDSGQLLTGSFADYFMPRAGLVPAISSHERPTTSRVSPLGVKGMGESGCTASLPALVNAVLDALAVLGIRHLDMPLTSAKLWTAIQSAGADSEPVGK